MRYEHKGLGLAIDLPDGITQRQLEEYFAGLRAAGVDANQLSSVEYSGGAVRQAALLGWLNGIGEVDGLPPKKVRWISARINDHVAAALAIPKE